MPNLVSEPRQLARRGTAQTGQGLNRKTLLWMALLGLALRLIVVGFLYQEQMPAARNHWVFGWETGQIAGSIASGHGFASPLHGETGATAWMAPLYPYLLAGVFKWFGSFTAVSALLILALNSLFSAATVFPVCDIASDLAGQRVATLAGWMWAVFPYAIYFSADRIWSHTLATFLLALMVTMGMRVAANPSMPSWIALGAITGLNAL